MTGETEDEPSIVDGTGYEFRANQPLFLDDAESAWIVEMGAVDLFLMKEEAAGVAGPRRHVLRVSTGQAIFGVGLTARARNLQLIAVGSPGARCRKVSLRYLKELHPDGAPNLTGTTLLDAWVKSMCNAIHSGLLPKRYDLAEPGRQIQVGAGRHVLCNEDVMWVKHLQGSSRFLGDTAIESITGVAYFPLTPQTWLETTETTMLVCIDTPELQIRDPQWRALEVFHQTILSALELRFVREAEQHALQSRSKYLSDRMHIDRSLSWLASAVAGKLHRSLAQEYSGGDPLLAACRIMGDALGMEIRGASRGVGHMVPQDALREIAAASRIRVRRVILQDAWWKTSHGPLLGYLQSGSQPVAVIPGRHGYEIHYPADGTSERVESQTSRLLDPVAYTFYRPFPAKKLTAWDLLHFGLQSLAPERDAILLSGVAAGLLGLCIPIFTGMLFDTVIPGANRTTLRQLTCLLLVAATATAMFEMTKSLALLRLEGSMGTALQSAVWDRLLTLPAAFFRQYSAGDLSDRANGIDKMRSILTSSVCNSIISGTFSCLNLALMLYYSWKLTIVALGLVLVAVTVTILLGQAQLRVTRNLTRVAGKLSGQVLEFISGVAKLRVAAAESRVFGVWSKRYSVQKNLQSQTRTLSNRFSVFHSVLLIAGPMALFYTVKEWAGPMSAGDFLAFNASFGQMFLATMNVSAVILSVMAVVPLYERAAPILQSPPEVTSSRSDPGELSGAIELSQVSFRYDADKPLVLKDISLRVRAGQFVALLGPSGCGKSTIFRLLLGFAEPEAGIVFYDGLDLKGIDATSVRRQMGVVLQNSFAFRGDILSNILGSRGLTIEDAWEAAQLAGLDQDIKQMPMGMHTVITETGGLSGGQRQRLMIARAIVGKPRILLLDEATSALDNHTQAIVSKSLEGLKATRIVIAHRLSTVINADHILVLDQGRVVQSGKYAELLQQGGLFAQLVERQLT
jgi:ATP-binding cassette subfamily C protein